MRKRTQKRSVPENRDKQEQVRVALARTKKAEPTLLDGFLWLGIGLGVGLAVGLEVLKPKEEPAPEKREAAEKPPW